MNPAETFSQPLSVTFEDVPGACVVRLVGTPGMENVNPHHEQLLDRIDDETPNVVADLSKLTFINSPVLAMLVHAHKKTHEHNGRVVIVRPSAVIARVLRLMHVERLFSEYATVDAALAALAGR
ncbi:STAS domain protein [Phycisphaerae bacterium RAS1]|nr:STAS domain protein [Phycisphaerae bacterium RAS1]